MTTAPVLTTKEAAVALRVSDQKVRKLARQCGVGYNPGGKSGWRFSPAEIEKMRDSMRPAAPVTRRRRRRAA